MVASHFLKQSHFIPTNNTLIVVECVDLFVKEKIEHYGLPQSILSDRDIKFTINFWKELMKCLNITLHMSIVIIF